MTTLAGKVSKWIVCQLGAREHYAVARALQRSGELALLVTDIWLHGRQKGFLAKFLPRLRVRAEPELRDTPTVAFTITFLLLSLLKRLVTHVARIRDAVTRFSDRLFQRRAAFSVASFCSISEKQKLIVFCYSYSAREIFVAAKARNWTTVLGQINPGPREEEIVREVYANGFGPGVEAPAAPRSYWESWRKECALADVIVANSVWSRTLLIDAGIPKNKIALVPLAYERPSESKTFARKYPTAFSTARPLRVLYLGAATPRKGLHILLRAARSLAESKIPVEFLVVGRDEMPGGVAKMLPPNARYENEVGRRDTAKFFRWADVFILPTFSDGFALTLLEAQAWRLPAIVSKRCGKVIDDDINGIELDEVCEIAIEACIRRFAGDSAQLRDYSERSIDFEAFSLETIGKALSELAERPQHITSM
jgi:glycosyltransferase involved in cell wall biosynthesis